MDLSKEPQFLITQPSFDRELCSTTISSDSLDDVQFQPDEVILENVSEERRAYRALYNLAQSRADTMMFSLTNDKCIDNWNESIESVMGVSTDSAIGSHVSTLFHSPDLIDWIDQGIGGAEIYYKALDIPDTKKSVMLNLIPRFDKAASGIEGVVCFIWDITGLSENTVYQIVQNDIYSRKEVSDMSRKIQALNSSLEMKRNFVRSVSHEIRTPLNIALAGLQLIENQYGTEISSVVLELIREIKQSCRDGVDILDDFLAYEKFDGKVTQAADKEEVSANALVRDCLQPFMMQARLNNVIVNYSECLLVEDCIKPCDDLIINVDQFKIRQVIRNLISNSIKFSPEGLVKCHVSWTPTSSDPSIECSKGFVCIKVIDNGSGLTKENQNRLFKEIVQFNAAAQQRGGGSGLGLYVAKSMVSVNGGAIGVHSDGPGKGSTFFVEFPLFKASVSPIPQSNIALKLRKMSREFSISGFRLPTTTLGDVHRLMIVDDSTLSRKMVARLLRPHFASVVESCDGIDALNKFTAAVASYEPFSIVLMDNEMSKLNGPPTAAELRKRGYKGLIIGLTGHGDANLMDDFIASGADHVFLKPLRHEEFLRVASELMMKGLTVGSSC